MDQTDYKILDILQRDGRISMQKLAKNINMSVTATIERVRKLEDSGTIVGYRVMLRPERVGREVLAFILVRVEYPKRNEFYAFVQQCDAIITVFEVTGQYTHLVETSCRDMNEFQKTVYALYDMGMTETCVVLDNVKNGIFTSAPEEDDVSCRGEYSPAKQRGANKRTSLPDHLEK